VTHFSFLGILIINAYESQNFVEIPQHSALLTAVKQSIFLVREFPLTCALGSTSGRPTNHTVMNSMIIAAPLPKTSRKFMNVLLFAAADIAAILILTFGLYLRRHRRRDLAVSYIGINIGVFAVATALAGSTVSAGLGMGLFGVLSIIRLRSTELEQHEIAYYFSALAIGLITGMGPTPIWLPLALVALILIAMLIADHSKVLPTYRHQEVILDRAIANDAEMFAHLSLLFGGATIHQAVVQQLDLVNDKTIVKVRYSQANDALPTSASTRSVENHEVISEQAR